MKINDPGRSIRDSFLAAPKKCKELYLVKENMYPITDANVPPMVTEEVIPTPCCYKLSLEPLPGHGFPLKVAAGFCHEPDHVQLHLNESSIALKEGGGAHTSVAGSTGTLSSADSTSLPATFHASTCDTILWPSTSLNVTSSGREFNSSLWHEHNNPSAVSGNKSSLANVEEDEDLMVALAKFLGVSSDSSSESTTRNEATSQSKSHGLTGLVLLLHPLIYRAAWLR